MGTGVNSGKSVDALGIRGYCLGGRRVFVESDDGTFYACSRLIADGPRKGGLIGRLFWLGIVGKAAGNAKSQDLRRTEDKRGFKYLAPMYSY